MTDGMTDGGVHNITSNNNTVSGAMSQHLALER